MSRSIGVKILVFLLTAAILVVLAGSAAAAIFLGQAGLFYRTPAEMIQMRLDHISDPAAHFAAFRYTLLERGFSEDLIVELAHRSATYLGYYCYDELESGQVEYALYSETNKLLDSSLDENFREDAEYQTNVYTVNCLVPALRFLSKDGPDIIDSPTPTTVPDTDYDTTLPVQAETDSKTYSLMAETLYLDAGPQGAGWYQVEYYSGPTYTVEIRLLPEIINRYYGDHYWLLTNRLYAQKDTVLILIPISFLLFVLGLVYLFWAAGWKPKTESVEPLFFNRMPLDLYLILCGVVGFFAAYFAVVLMDWSLTNGGVNALVPAVLCLLISAFAVVLFLYAFTAQIKLKNGYWWRSSLLGRLLRLIGRGLLWVLRRVRALVRLLPLVWQWILVAVGMAFLYGITIYWAFYDTIFPLLFVISLCIGIVLYGAYSFGVLIRGARKMAKGDLHHQISTKYLIGSFRDCAEDLNKLADVAVVAAKKQMQSERMKTELITNVSHDIKTPLTSIINFVDLLQKPHTEEEGVQYLDVLNRQSLRLKRLIEDLMDLSKASTGNMTVNLAEMDAVEVVNQALGEFADKLDSVQLIPVFREPEIPAKILADGRLSWRVLSNLLTNAVKYALPGTRLYVDVVPLEGKVLVSLKNISREQLSVSAEDLMERFVRGDAARNTEGSGLGLNIARSLMEVQHGQLQLLVDGDLFKVTLLFPSPQ